MGKTYIGQTKLVFKINTKTDLTNVIEAKLKFSTPSGNNYERIANVLDAETGQIEYDVQAGDFTEVGKHTFWVYLTYSDGEVAPSESFTHTFYEEGE